MSGHTPGPWEVDFIRRGHWAINCSPTVLDETHCTEIVAEISDPVGYMPAAENKANARLIAASPDLLSVCKKLIAWANGCDDDRVGVETEGAVLMEIEQEARDAIAKAEGREA